MHCYIHSHQEAVGSCVACGHAVCLLCLNKLQGRFFCDTCARHQSLNAPPPQISLRLNELSLHNRYVAAVLAMTLGCFGAHKFYLRQNGWGLLYLMFFWSGLPALVGFLEGIAYLTQSDEQFAAYHHLPLTGVISTPLFKRAELPRAASPLKSTPPSPRLHTDADYERCLLHYAREHQGVLTIGQIVADTPINIDKAEHYLLRLEARGYTRVEIDPQTGVIRYLFPEFMHNGLQGPERFRDY
jgi:TM2 domain-containing membrane protein YozV